MEPTTPPLLGKLQLALGSLALVLTLSLITLSFVNRGRQARAQALLAEIGNARAARQVAGNVVRDLAQLAQRDPEILGLLKRNGIDLKPAAETPAR